MTGTPNSGNTRKWSMADVADALGGTVAAMAKGSFELVGTGAMMFTIGVYVDGLKADDLTKTLTDAMRALNYGKSSRYALASAALDVGRGLIKRYGRPDAVKDLNVFWQLVADTETVPDAVAFYVAAIKADHGVNTVQELNAKLHPAKAVGPKAEKTVADKVAELVNGATSAQAANMVASLVRGKVNPADFSGLILGMAQELDITALSGVLVQLGTVLTAKLAAEARPELKAA